MLKIITITSYTWVFKRMNSINLLFSKLHMCYNNDTFMDSLATLIRPVPILPHNQLPTQLIVVRLTAV